MRKAVVVTAVLLGVGLAAAGVTYGAAAEQEAGHQKGQWSHHGMMGQRSHHMMGLCPFMTPGAEIKVTPTKTGATIEVTATDPTTIAKIQKKAQILQLMHELKALEPQKPATASQSSPDQDDDDDSQS